MSDVISLDKILEQFALEQKRLNPHINVPITKQALHSLLISKLPEKKQPLRGIDVAIENTASKPKRDGYNSAISDVKAVLDELFGSGDER